MNGVDHFGNEPSAMKSSSRQWLASARSIAVAESKFAILGFTLALGGSRSSDMSNVMTCRARRQCR